MIVAVQRHAVNTMLLLTLAVLDRSSTLATRLRSRIGSRTGSSSSGRLARTGSSRSSSYGGWRYSALSTRGSVYGYSAYTYRATYLSGSYDPTVCYNNVSLLADNTSFASTSTVATDSKATAGYFVCPLPDDEDSSYCCCGDEDEQFCCSSWEFATTYYRVEMSTAGTIVAVFLLSLLFCGVKRLKRKKVSQGGLANDEIAVAASENQQPTNISSQANGILPQLYGYYTDYNSGRICPQVSTLTPCEGTPPPKYEDEFKAPMLIEQPYQFGAPVVIQLPNQNNAGPV